MVAYKKEQARNAPDALERMIAYKKSRGELDPAPPPPPPVAAAPGAPKTPKQPKQPFELSALTTDQFEQAAMQERALQDEYDRLLNAFSEQEARGQLGFDQETRAARNVQAGDTQNLATNLASIGMDLSPGPALVGEQNIAETSVTRQAGAQQSLASLLAEIESQKTRATSSKSRGLADLQKLINQQRIANTMLEQQSAYGQFE
jgi:hypothetical protein